MSRLWIRPWYSTGVLVRTSELFRDWKAAEAGYLVGYHCPSQFSREYKRHFGFAPSAT
jgi:AraC-like DNA-binding protein